MYRQLTFAVLIAAAFFTVSLEAQTRSLAKNAPLEQRDPELADWVDTLATKLQAKNVRIRNSAAQALISIGADAAPRLMKLRETSDRKTRRLVTRILERIGRESGRNMFRDVPGRDSPASLSKDISRVLKLDEGSTTMLGEAIQRAQEKEREIKSAEKKREIGAVKARAKRDQIKKLTRTELQAFLDEKQTRYVMARLGWASQGEILDVEDPGNEQELEKRKRNRDQDR